MQKMPGVKLVIFDMDGVLLDSEPMHQRARDMMFQKYGLVNDGTLFDPVGRSTAEFWALVEERVRRGFDPLAKEVEHFELVARQVEQGHTPPSAGAAELMAWAKDRGVMLGLASSSSRFMVDRVLAALGLRRYLDFTVCGDEVQNKKPAPDIYQRVMTLADMGPDVTAAVEDSDPGVAAAKAAGLFCFGYKNPTSGHQTLKQADMVIEHLADIKEYLK